MTFSIFPVKKGIFGKVIFSTRLANARQSGRVALSLSTRNVWSDGLRRSARDAPELRPPVYLTALALDTVARAATWMSTPANRARGRSVGRSAPRTPAHGLQAGCAARR